LNCAPWSHVPGHVRSPVEPIKQGAALSKPPCAGAGHVLAIVWPCSCPLLRCMSRAAHQERPLQWSEAHRGWDERAPLSECRRRGRSVDAGKPPRFQSSSDRNRSAEVVWSRSAVQGLIRRNDATHRPLLPAIKRARGGPGDALKHGRRHWAPASQPLSVSISCCSADLS
jgi:hypothetical protein